MYSVMLAAMLTTTSATPEWGCHGCYGCSGYTYCHGCCGGQPSVEPESASRSDGDHEAGDEQLAQGVGGDLFAGGFWAIPTGRWARQLPQGCGVGPFGQRE